MALNVILIGVDILALSVAAVALHRISPRTGLTPLLSYVIGLTGLLQTAAAALNYIRLTPDPGWIVVLGSTVLVPVILLVVLILYVIEGTFVARQAIYGTLGVTLLSFLVSQILVLHLKLPGGANWLGMTAEDPIFTFNIGTIPASLLSFGADLLTIVIVYQALTNRVRFLPRWLNAGLALVAALWVDTLLFSALAFGIGPDYIRELADDLVTKTAAGLVAFPVLAVYIGMVAPRIFDLRAHEKRHTLHLFLGRIGQIEEALREAETARLASARQVQSMQSYIGDATHDLKHPLTTIGIYLTMLRQVDSEGQRKKGLDVIQQQTVRLEQIIDDLLILSRLDEDTVNPTTRLDLNGIVREACESVQPLVNSSAQTLVVTLYESLPEAEINPLDMARAIDNLLKNAVQYTPSGGRIEVETRHEGDEIIVQVRDTGAGIESEDIPHIFDRFYRAQQVVAQKTVRGTGLGLSVVKGVVDRHGGKVGVNSEVGRGSTFEIRLPARYT